MLWRPLYYLRGYRLFTAYCGFYAAIYNAVYLSRGAVPSRRSCGEAGQDRAEKIPGCVCSRGIAGSVLLSVL